MNKIIKGKTFKEITFTNTDNKHLIENKTFIDCVFYGVNFNAITFNDVKFESCTFKKSSFVLSDINESCFINNIFELCEFDETNIKITNFENNCFSKGVIESCSIEYCSFMCEKLATTAMDNNYITCNKVIKMDINLSTITDTHFYSNKYFGDVKFRSTLLSSSVIFNKEDLKNVDLYPLKLCACTTINCLNHDHIIRISFCPAEGSFIGYKKCRYNDKEGRKDCIVKLKITEDAKRISQLSGKCRCSKAEVLKITDLTEGNDLNSCYSFWDLNYVYKVGEIVIPDKFCNDKDIECGNGIHFFMSRKEAEDFCF